MLASAWKQKRQDVSKEKLRRGFGRPSKSAANPATRKFRAEVEELKLRTQCNRCGTDTGHENVHRNPCNGGMEVDEVDTQRGKNEYFSKKTERLTSVTGSPQHESRFLCFCESKHCSLLERLRKRREQRCSLLEKAKKQRMERARAIGEYEAMLNSSPGKGIIYTGCAKMMLGSDTFKQCLDLLSSKGTCVRRESAREEPFQVRRHRDEDVALVRGHPNECSEARVS